MSLPAPSRRLPPPGPGEAQVRVAWCGICGSDVHEYRAGPFKIPLEPHPVTGQRAPIALGHEISAHVTAVGDDVEGLAPGDLVALNALLPCGRCAPCARGDEHLCLQLGHLGMSADGGLAELLTVPAAMVVPAPAGLDPAVAALAEPFAVGVHALRKAGRPRGARCTVIGAGTIGLAVALLLRADGNEVVLVDVAAERIAHAARLGLRAVTVEDGRAAYGTAAVVVECSGAASAPEEALRHAEPGGTVVLAGLPEEPVLIDVATHALREVVVVGSMSHLADLDMAPALAYLAEHAEEAAGLVTARIPLEQAVSSGLEALTGPDRARHAKILVQVAHD